MRGLLITLLFLISCSSAEDRLPLELGNYDCGSIDNPYTLAESYFKLDEVVYLRLNFVQFICTSDSLKKPHNWDEIIHYLNSEMVPTKVQFVKGFIGYQFINDPSEINDYKKHLLLLEKYYSLNNIDPAITVMVYPNNSNWWPGAAVSIPATGFAIQEYYLLSSTLIHETLHCLGLKHTHTPDATDGKNYTTGDNICDLAYHPPMLSGTYDCVLIKDPQRVLSREDQEKLVKNYMSYTDKFCRDNLTPVQIDRIRKTIEVTPVLLKTIAFPNVFERIDITKSDLDNLHIYEYHAE